MKRVIVSANSLKINHTKLTEDFRRLADSVFAAKMHYDIYHVFMNEVDYPKFVTTMNFYIEFFRPAIAAHFTAMVISLSAVYDEGDNCVSISKLLEQLGTLKNSDHRKKILELQNQIIVLRPLIRKVVILRNNDIAHISAKLTTSQTFQRADMTRYDFRDLINKTQTIMQEIGRLIGEDFYPCATDVSESGTRAMLHSLKMWREYELNHPEQVASFISQYLQKDREWKDRRQPK